MKGNALDFSFSGTQDRGAALGGGARYGGGDRSAARAAARESRAVRGAVAGGDAAGHARSAGFVPARGDRRTADARRGAAAETIDARSLIVSGGVACNCGPARARPRAARLPYPVYFPTPGLSTDNAAMIAAAAFPQSWRNRNLPTLDVTAQANLRLAGEPLRSRARQGDPTPVAT